MSRVFEQPQPLIEAIPRPRRGLRAVGLFAGIGGIERGLHLSGQGHSTELLCEIEPAAKHVLEQRFPDVPIVEDVRELPALPACDLLAAGFPCQDLSQAGRTAGITGERSGLVGEVFRLFEPRMRDVRWLLLENVPFMLQLERGAAMRFLTRELSRMGLRWAYRVVDSRSFGVPQRRRRVVLLASATEDPRRVLFADEAGVSEEPERNGLACGFYWTEGVRGLGWAANAVPTLKGGSTIGIPSPPAIWMPDGRIVTPDIRDAERLQGFPADWTTGAHPSGPARNGPRWKLIGNAVTVPMASWLGERLGEPGEPLDVEHSELLDGERWPDAAWGENGRVWRAGLSAWPRPRVHPPLGDFLSYPTVPLSPRATAGFLLRAERGRLRFPEGFLDDVRSHLRRVS